MIVPCFKRMQSVITLLVITDDMDCAKRSYDSFQVGF